MSKNLLFGALIFFVNSSAVAANNQDLSTLAVSSEWSKLLHHNQIDQETFYASGNHRSSALTELVANIDKLKNDPRYGCDFPARAKFLSARLQLQLAECPAVQEWKKLISGDSVSLVYVTQYVSNPASAFGHTFLLFKKQKRPLNLAAIISNAASMPPDVNDFDYIVKGLTGGFPAQFSEDSFYVKIQDYNNIENRDMWVYDLNFSSDQIDQLLNHIWELSRRGSQGYLFLNKNCAVNTYNALAAIHPDLEFIPTSLYVLPVETVVKVRPLSTRIEYLPSLREKMRLRTAHLSPDERAEFKRAVATDTPFSRTDHVEIAELVLENFELVKSRQAGLLTSDQSAKQAQALLNRAQLSDGAHVPILDSPPPPHEALPAARVAVFGGTQGNQSFYGFSAAPYYHSLLERSAGYLPFSEFIILDAEAQKISDGSQLSLILLQAANFPSVTVFDSLWSWKIRSQIDSSVNCEGCLDFNGELSAGKSLAPSPQNRLFALLGLYKDHRIKLAPQILLGGLSDTRLGHALYQLRTIKELDDSKFKTLLELGFNFSLGSRTNLEILASLGEGPSNFRSSLDYHF